VRAPPPVPSYLRRNAPHMVRRVTASRQRQQDSGTVFCRGVPCLSLITIRRYCAYDSDNTVLYSGCCINYNCGTRMKPSNGSLLPLTHQITHLEKYIPLLSNPRAFRTLIPEILRMHGRACLQDGQGKLCYATPSLFLYFQKPRGTGNTKLA